MILAVVFVGLIFTLLGLIIVVKPEAYIKLTQWQIRTIWAGEFKASKETANRMRTLGAFFFLLGIIVLYTHLMLGYA